MAIYAFIAIILVFVAGIGYQAFSLTSDIDGRIAGGAGAITAAILGACILIGLFIFLMRRQHQRDRNEHRGDPSFRTLLTGTSFGTATLRRSQRRQPGTR